MWRFCHGIITEFKSINHRLPQHYRIFLWFVFSRLLKLARVSFFSVTCDTVTKREKHKFWKYLPVVPQMILPAKSLPAYVAWVRSLVGVCPFVDQQVIALGELSIAKLADELFLGSLTRWSSCEERRRRWRHRDQTLMRLMIIKVRTGLRTATPSGQQSCTPEPVV